MILPESIFSVVDCPTMSVSVNVQPGVQGSEPYKEDKLFVFSHCVDRKVGSFSPNSPLSTG